MGNLLFIKIFCERNLPSDSLSILFHESLFLAKDQTMTRTMGEHVLETHPLKIEIFTSTILSGVMRKASKHNFNFDDVV